MRGDKAHEGLGAEAYLQYVEHPNRVQRRQRAALWFRSRKLVRNGGLAAVNGFERSDPPSIDYTLGLNNLFLCTPLRRIIERLFLKPESVTSLRHKFWKKAMSSQQILRSEPKKTDLAYAATPQCRENLPNSFGITRGCICSNL